MATAGTGWASSTSRSTCVLSDGRRAACSAHTLSAAAPAAPYSASGPDSGVTSAARSAVTPCATVALPAGTGLCWRANKSYGRRSSRRVPVNPPWPRSRERGPFTRLSGRRKLDGLRRLYLVRRSLSGPLDRGRLRDPAEPVVVGLGRTDSPWPAVPATAPPAAAVPADWQPPPAAGRGAGAVARARRAGPVRDEGPGRPGGEERTCPPGWSRGHRPRRRERARRAGLPPCTRPPGTAM